MAFSTCQRLLATMTLLTTCASAFTNVVAPTNITATQAFPLTFDGANNSSTYRVYLAAQLTDTPGPTCTSSPPSHCESSSPTHFIPGYLLNHTLLPSPLTLTIPPGIGPSASYYLIGLRTLPTDALSALTTTTAPEISYSNPFTLTGANGTYSAYENALHGAAFWSADDLPCDAYPCARACAQKGYPQDLSEEGAYAEMSACIAECPGVSAAGAASEPPLVQGGGGAGTTTAIATGTAGSTSTASNTAVAKGGASVLGEMREVEMTAVFLAAIMGFWLV